MWLIDEEFPAYYYYSLPPKKLRLYCKEATVIPPNSVGNIQMQTEHLAEDTHRGAVCTS